MHKLTLLFFAVDHLAKYLAIRIKLDFDEANRCRADASTVHNFSRLMKSDGVVLNTTDEKDKDESCKIYVAQSGNLQMLTSLSGDLTLENVVQKFWKIKKPLELHFLLSSRCLKSEPSHQQNNVNAVATGDNKSKINDENKPGAEN